MAFHHDQENSEQRIVQVFRNGRSRAIRLPKEFEFSADAAILRRQPDGSILVMPALSSGLSDYLKTAEPWTGGDFLSSDEDLRELDEVTFL